MKPLRNLAFVVAAAALAGCSLSSLTGGGGKPVVVLQTLTPEAADPGAMTRSAATRNSDNSPARAVAFRYPIL